MVSKEHLQIQELHQDYVSFARLEESRQHPPTCSALNATGMCVEWSWLEACEASSERLFLTTYAEETLDLGGPQIQPLGHAYNTARTSWKRNKSHSFYIGEPEAWNLVLEHRLSSILGTYSGQDLRGFLRHSQPSVEGLRPIEYVFEGLPATYYKQFGSAEKDNRLKIPVRDLLSSVSLHLDQECERCAEFNVTGEASRLRRVGLELDVTLFHSNLWFSWSDPWTWFLPSQNVTFEVQISARQPVEGVRTIRTVGHSELSIEAPAGVNFRITRRSYGIRVIFHQRGIIGKSSASSLVAFILKSLTFLSVAWTLSELILDFAPLGCKFVGYDVPSWYTFLVSQNSADVWEGVKKKDSNKDL